MITYNLIKDLKGYKERYAFTEDHQIYSYPKKNHEGKILKPCKNSAGYLCLYLYKNKKRKNYLYHRLVSLNYIPNPNNYPFINHIDGNKLNNHPSNLEWCTNAQNKKHASLKGLVSRGIKRHNAKLKEKDIYHIRFMLKNGLSTYKIASWFGVCQNTICRIKNKKTWCHV